MVGVEKLCMSSAVIVFNQHCLEAVGVAVLGSMAEFGNPGVCCACFIAFRIEDSTTGEGNKPRVNVEGIQKNHLKSQ